MRLHRQGAKRIPPAGRAMPACIGGRSMVYTPRGDMPVSEIAPGDPLYSFDDYTLAERECVRVTNCGLRPSHRVTLEDGRQIISTMDQMLVKVVDPKTNIKWAMRWFVWEPLAEFHPGDTVIASRVMPHQIVQKPLVEEEEFARYIGFRDATLAEYAVNPFYDETYIELLTITAIQPAGDHEVYEVEVQFDESFVAGGFVLL